MSAVGGRGIINRTIDALPFELHLPGRYNYCGPGTKLEERLTRGDRGINPLDEFCREHDISYRDHKDTASRRIADKRLANRAWERFKSKATPLGEKAAAWLVTTAMNVKNKLGAGKRKRRRGRKNNMKKNRKGSGQKSLPFSTLVRHAKAAIRGSGVKSSKMVEKDQKRLRAATLAALRAVRSIRKGKRISGVVRGQRFLPLPKSGGLLPLLPIFAGLSAIGSLAGGAAGVAKAMSDTRDARRRLEELQRHNKSMEDIALHKGKGLFLRPYPKGGLGLYMKPYTKCAKNC